MYLPMTLWQYAVIRNCDIEAFFGYYHRSMEWFRAHSALHIITKSCKETSVTTSLTSLKYAGSEMSSQEAKLSWTKRNVSFKHQPPHVTSVSVSNHMIR